MPEEPYDFYPTVLQVMEDHHWLTGNDRWLLAVSGGADSMAMLDLMTRLQAQRGPEHLYLHIAHMNHHLRDRDSDQDAAFVAEQAAQRNLPCTIADRDIAALSAQNKQSLETAARQERYAFLTEVAAVNLCEKVITAHTQNDQAETILSRIVRGTGLHGLAGIPFERELDTNRPLRLIRPMLTISRPDVENYLRRRGLPWREDASNTDPDYTRNRIRHELLPLLETYNPQVTQALLRLSEIARLYDRAVGTITEQWLDDHAACDETGTLTLNRHETVSLNLLQQTELIRHVLNRLGVGMQTIGLRHINQAAAVLAGTQKACTLPGPVEIKSTCQAVIFSLPSQKMPPPASIAVLLPGITPIHSDYRWYSRKARQARRLTQIEGRYESASLSDSDDDEIIDADKLHGKLQLRTWHISDCFAGLGMTGQKTLGNFFTDEKIPPALRPRLALLTDDAGIVWILGLRIAQRVKVTDQTRRILHLQIQ